MNHIKWVFENMKGSRAKFFWGIIMHNLLCMPCVVIAPIFLSKFVDRVFKGGTVSIDQTAYMLVAAFLITTILRCIFSYTYLVLLDSAANDVLFNLRNALYKKLSILSPSFYSRTRTGDIMMRLTGDLEAIRHFVAWVATNAIYAVGIFIAGLIVFYSTNWILATVLLITAPFFGGILMIIRKRTAPLYTHLRETNSRLNAMVQENIAGNRVVRAFVREDFEQEKFEEVNHAYRDAAINSSMVWNKLGPVVTLIGNTGLVIVLLIGGIMTIYDKMTVGELLLFYNLNWLINESMRLIGVVLNDSQRFFSCTQKVIQLYYARTDIKQPEKPVICNQKEEGKVEFCNVDFRYNSKSDVLKNINITAQPGQTIGIMGPTGSGKSTLFMLMARFYDVCGGSIKIDGIDVRDYDLSQLRGKIGISMQDVFLFSNTIDSNICYGNMDLSEEAVVEYAKMADADGFIRKTSDSYDTIIGERGVGLSGGQKQRIALARALAYESPIIVLDDTTSALDMETEKTIQQQLAARQGKHTTFIIAQRISSVKDADMIYIIENNTVSECGTHRQLLDKKGYYYDIYCLQQGIKNEKEGK